MAQNQFYDDRILNEFGRDYVKILVAFLKKNKKVASGALINSINYKLKNTAQDIIIALEANDYLEYVDAGRKPGSWPPIREIGKWASIKGISQEAVFPIARKIFKFGIEPTNVISKTIREIETSPTLRKKYEDELAELLEKTIIEKIENNQ